MLVNVWLLLGVVVPVQRIPAHELWSKEVAVVASKPNVVDVPLRPAPAVVTVPKQQVKFVISEATNVPVQSKPGQPIKASTSSRSEATTVPVQLRPAQELWSK